MSSYSVVNMAPLRRRRGAGLVLKPISKVSARLGVEGDRRVARRRRIVALIEAAALEALRPAHIGHERRAPAILDARRAGRRGEASLEPVGRQEQAAGLGRRRTGERAQRGRRRRARPSLAGATLNRCPAGPWFHPCSACRPVTLSASVIVERPLGEGGPGFGVERHALRVVGRAGIAERHDHAIEGLLVEIIERRPRRRSGRSSIRACSSWLNWSLSLE